MGPGFPTLGPLKLCPHLACEQEAVFFLVAALESILLGDAGEAVATPGSPVLEDGCGLNVGGVARAARLRRAEPLHLHARPVELAFLLGFRLQAAEDVADENALACRAADVLRRHLEGGRLERGCRGRDRRFGLES